MKYYVTVEWRFQGSVQARYRGTFALSAQGAFVSLFGVCTVV